MPAEGKDLSSGALTTAQERRAGQLAAVDQGRRRIT
jgi:hypothetical protein